jgi:hypothetical protein
MRQLCLGVIVLLSLVAGVTAPGAAAAPAPTRWCGADESAADRLDAVASYQVHVVYAIPSDGNDQFAQRALPIARDLAAVDSWWQLQDSARAPRFDLATFPGCDSAFGALDISVVRLPQSGAVYGAFDPAARTALLGTDVRTALGNVSFAKKYLVYYDGPVNPGVAICGFSSRGPTDRGGSMSIVILDLAASEAGSCGEVGASDYLAVTAAHELLHNLGAVPDEAPHVCSSGHVCDSGDIMAPQGHSNSLFDYAMDVGHDDYYGHSGAWWDVQDSPFLSLLSAPRYPLTVTIEGSQGTVSSDVPGISCPPACSIEWESGTQLQLTGEPEGDRARFAGFSGACSGDTCVLTMDGPKSVTARFVEARTLHLAVGGAGRITGPQGIDCTDACDFDLDEGTQVTLRAVPDRGARLVSWSVAACGARPTCAVTTDADKTVRATFGLGTVRLTARVTGRGTVRSTPAGIACPRACSRAFTFGRAVQLTARAAAGWKFVAWSGACHGVGRCTVRLTRAGLVRAQFRRS